MKKINLLTKQKRKFLLYNLIAFTIIFSIIGLISMSAVERSFYKESDRELNLEKHFIIQQNWDLPLKPGQPNIFRRNPRIHYLIYDENKILILKEVPFVIDFETFTEPTEEETRYNIKLNNYNYRILSFAFENNNNYYYVQILIDIDGEIGLRNNIMNIYLICLIIIVILAISASYLMSAITLQPIKKSINDQNRFVSDASHELRTPLTTILSRLEYLLTKPDETMINLSSEITDCLSEVTRLIKLSNNLLMLAKNDFENELDLSSFDLFQLINQVSAPYIEIANSANKTIFIKGQKTLIKADKNKILQVLVILLDNAIKYTRPGDKIIINLEKNKNRHEIIISDTGIGISKKGMQHLFERFYRDDNSRSLVEGSGLGLSIAKQIITRHHGFISAEPNKPQGTIFKIII